MKRITILSGLIALISLTSCNSKQEEKEVAETYSVTNPITIDTSFTKEYVSQIRSIKTSKSERLKRVPAKNLR
jgi:membrane fusion protein (multidrug efflux system)